MGGKTAGCVDDHGHACGHLKPVHLVPKAALAQHVAVVAGEHDDGVVAQPAVIQGFDQRTNLGVDVAAGAVVGAPGAQHGFGWHGFAPQVNHLEQALRVRVLRVLRQFMARHAHVFVAVQVPEFVGNGVGVVRVRHGHGQAKRLLGGVAHMVVQVLAGLEHHLFVKVDLVGSHAGAGLQHGGHVVVPTGAHVGLVPVHGPAVIGGVNVTGQALFIAVQLVGATKMHLARKRRAVAQTAQVMSVGRHIGWKVSGIVKAANFGRQLPTHQAETRGRAQRAVAIGRVKHHTVFSQCAQVRHLNGRAGVVQRQQRRGHLVGHDEQNIGTAFRHENFLD